MLKKTALIMLLLPIFAIGQHTIKGTFSPAEDYKFALLYKVTPTTSTYIKNSEVNPEGQFIFQMDSTLTKGMYRIVYALPQEEFNFDVIYNAKEDVALTFNSETGIEYQESIENKLVNSYTYSMSLVSQSIGNFFDQQSTDSLALASIFKTQQETQNSYEKAANETIALQFIKANRPYVPDGFEDIKTYIKNLKGRFFEYVDFNNEILQSSNFLIERMLNYVFGMISEGDDEIATYKRNIGEVILAMKDADVVIKKRLLEVLWQQMVDTNFEEVANFISDAYLIEIAETLKDDELANGLRRYKSLAIGNPAPEFTIEVAEGGLKTTKTLGELNTAEQYVIVFWSSTCSHCLEEIPQLKEYVNSLEKGKLQIVAIGLEEEPFRWRNETFKYPEFIHVLGLGKWQNEIGISYNVTATPTYYVLDGDKKIIAKPDDFNALKRFLD